MELNRRGFIKGVGMVGALGAFAVAGSDATAMAQEENQVSSEEAWEAGRQLSLEEVNKLRDEFINSYNEDWVCSDGTVVPSVYVKLYALMHTEGMGLNYELSDHSFDILMMEYTEEQAQQYLDFPHGVMFTAADLATKGPKTEQEYADICTEFADRGILVRITRAGIPYYHTLPEIHGQWEYSAPRYIHDMDEEEALAYVDAHTAMRPRTWEIFYSAGTPNYFPIPVHADVVAEGECVLPYEDIEAIIDRNEIIAVHSCSCHANLRMHGKADPDWPWPEERCLIFGENAEYELERGYARPLTKEEARAFISEMRDIGMVFQSVFNKTNGAVCMCHGSVCGFLRTNLAMGDAYADANARPNVGRYQIQYDSDDCIHCGACVQRCPLFAITMNDEGCPEVNCHCVGCGQCAYVCPAEARKLVQKANEIPEMPEDYLVDQNQKSAYRFANNLVYPLVKAEQTD